MSKAQLYMKMLKVMEEVGQLKKDGSVKDFSGKKMYDYLSEEQVTGELQAAFIKHKLVVFPHQVDEEFFYIEGTNAKGAYRNPTTKVNVKYKIVDAETGEFEVINSVGYGTDTADKGSNKAMTGAFKYAMRQSFAISTGDDGDHTSSDAITHGNTSEKPHTGPQTQRNTETRSSGPAASSGQSGSSHPSMRVFALSKELGWKSYDLNAFASDVLQREVKYPMKDYVKTLEDWEKIEQALIVTKEAS
ncbi:ERF family protein [Paenibacillus sp. GYB003]|uniref:ERF family protein n=1 Tax=Paenibacillus sp. GYB003 TaxID=2994392 RepID=UPI002F962E65